MKIGMVVIGGVCLAIGFFIGKTIQQEQTIARIEIVNASDQAASAVQIVTKGGALDPGESREILYGMRGESGYAFKVDFADGSSSELPDVYVSAGDKQVITIAKDKKVSLK
jgi:hypothetical protein